MSVSTKQATTFSGFKTVKFLAGGGGRRVILVVGILVAWQAYVMVTQVSPLLFPSPVSVGSALAGGLFDGSLAQATAATLQTLLIGTIIGILGGLVLAALSVASVWGAELLRLLTALFNPLPSIAILPLAMIWFGLNQNAIIFVVVNSAIWPVALNTDMGFRTISPTLKNVGLNLGLSKSATLWQVMLPAALPYMTAGVRTAWAFGWRTVVAAELVFGAVGGAGGLGWLINQSRFFLETDKVFAGLVVISFLGIIVDYLFKFLDNRTVIRWGMSVK